MGTFPQGIPNIVNNMGSFPQVIPNIVNNMGSFPQVIPKTANKKKNPPPNKLRIHVTRRTWKYLHIHHHTILFQK